MKVIANFGTRYAVDHRRQSIGVHGVRTPPIFGLPGWREGKGKGKGREGRGTLRDFYLDWRHCCRSAASTIHDSLSLLQAVNPSGEGSATRVLHLRSARFPSAIHEWVHSNKSNLASFSRWQMIVSLSLVVKDARMKCCVFKFLCRGPKPDEIVDVYVIH